MLEFWNSLSYTTKFSIISFILTAILGLASMGFLGIFLYYPVSILFKSYPTLNKWKGDWVWAAIITIGMAWSIGFIFGGLAWHFISKITNSLIILRIVYAGILLGWDALLFYLVIKSKLTKSKKR